MSGIFLFFLFLLQKITLKGFLSTNKKKRCCFFFSPPILLPSTGRRRKEGWRMMDDEAKVERDGGNILMISADEGCALLGGGGGIDRAGAALDGAKLAQINLSTLLGYGTAVAEEMGAAVTNGGTLDVVLRAKLSAPVGREGDHDEEGGPGEDLEEDLPDGDVVRVIALLVHSKGAEEIPGEIDEHEDDGDGEESHAEAGSLDGLADAEARAAEGHQAKTHIRKTCFQKALFPRSVVEIIHRVRCCRHFCEMRI